MGNHNPEGGILPLNYPALPRKSRSFPHLGPLLLAFLCTSLFLYFARPRHGRNPAYLIHARNGAVASENGRCSDVGVGVLKDGGNAVDAAIAATFCIGVVNMFSSGIGGGGLMTVRVPPQAPSTQSQVYTIDFRETAPALANVTMFTSSPQLSRYGGLSVAVPGEVRGLEDVHNRWGTLPWERLVQPSIDLAKGWQVDRELARRIPLYSDLMLNNPDWSAIFSPNGRMLQEGETIRRTNLSRTLEAISIQGANAFYKVTDYACANSLITRVLQGPIADSIVRKTRLTGGILSNADLENYTVIVDHALEGSYNGRKVYTTHAPSSGPVLLHMLNLVEHYPLEKRNSLNIHRVVEALKFGFAARTRVGDPRFTTDTHRIDEIATKAFAEKIFKNITDIKTHTPDYYNPVYDVKVDHGTSHTSVVDKNDMAVALTSTVNLVFGSQVLDPETGIILNDEMDDFSTPGFPNAFGLWPSPYNYPEPGKRPLSSMVPTIIEHSDGSLYLAIGAAGGSRIFGSVFQVLLNLDWGLDVSEAIEFGRLHDQLYPLALDADNTYPGGILRDLKALGHNVSVADINRVAAAVQAVMQNGYTISAASDSRKNGVAAGY